MSKQFQGKPSTSIQFTRTFNPRQKADMHKCECVLKSQRRHDVPSRRMQKLASTMMNCPHSRKVIGMSRDRFDRIEQQGGWTNGALNEFLTFGHLCIEAHDLLKSAGPKGRRRIREATGTRCRSWLRLKKELALHRFEPGRISSVLGRDWPVRVLDGYLAEARSVLKVT
ncbi:MAG: hypothetical protein OXH76_08355 [Boseongicola sp.]|nr:hypothetical protein [Boseongicola sp.]